MAKREEVYYDANGNPVQVKKKRNPFLMGCLGLILLGLLFAACTAALGGKVDTEDKTTTTEETTTTEKTTEEKKDNATAQQKAALSKAETYSDMMHMSKKGIYNQLTSEADKFKPEDAQYAVDNLKADYKENALKKAESYQKDQNMSADAILSQLTSEIEGFTQEEAQYAVDNLSK